MNSRLGSVLLPGGPPSCWDPGSLADPLPSRPGLFRAAPSLAAAVRHDNFGVLSSASPAAGRIAAPLGEKPQAWRAAPDAAIDVASDTLVISPSGGGRLALVE